MAKNQPKPAASAPAAVSGEVETKTEQSANVPATAPASGIAGIMGKFKVAKRVTMPTINPGVGEQHIFKIMDPMRESTYKSPDAEKEKPATVCTVTDIETGMLSLWIVPEVARKNLQEAYANDGYVGRFFAVQKLPKRPGKRYFDFEIAELETSE